MNDVVTRAADVLKEKKFLNFIIAEVIQHHKKHQS